MARVSTARSAAERRPEPLRWRHAAACALRELQDLLFLDEDETGTFFNLDKEIGGADCVQEVTAILDKYGFAPKVEGRPVTPCTTVACRFCHEPVIVETAHAYQGEWVGECCWDERLTVTA